MNDGTIQRRNKLWENTPAELAIRAAVDAVEAAGADPLLTEAVNLLHQARERVADFVDRRQERQAFLDAEAARPDRDQPVTLGAPLVLLHLLRDGGEIVSTASCSEIEIVAARACGRVWVDADGFGYLYRRAEASP